MPETVSLPPLLDHHTHPLLYAAFGKTVSLFSVETKEHASDLLRNAADDIPSGIVVANGWRSNLYDWNPDELETLPPLAIFNVSLHSLKLNSAGRDIMQAHYGDDVRNVANQDWYEDNFRLVLNWFANLYASEEALTDFYESIGNLGIHIAEELLLIDEREIELFRGAGLIDRTRFWSAPDTFESLTKIAQASVYGLKLFTDGAIGARTAAISRPFRQTGSVPNPNLGRILHTDAQLDGMVDACLITGKSLAVHAIGDRAIDQAISILENHFEGIQRVPEVRIEHAQLIDRDMAMRAKDLGIVLSMQPNFSSDSVDYRERLDERFCLANNPFRMLIDETGFEPGVDLVFGSDGMPHGIEYALEQSLFPSVPTQRLTMDEFQAGYCLNDFPKTVQVIIDEANRKVTLG